MRAPALCALLALAAAARADDAADRIQRGAKHAIVCGVTRYQDAQVTPLAASARDAQALAGMLRDERRTGGYAVTLLLEDQATRGGIADALQTVGEQSGPNDTVLFFFSGHGCTTGDGEAYLVTHDARVRTLADTGYSVRQVLAKMRQMEARQRILILDCCRSGALGEMLMAAARTTAGGRFSADALDRLAQGSGTVILSSSRGDQLSYEDTQPGGSGLGFFTKHLLRGLAGDADADWGREGAGNKDGFVSIAELADYVYYKANAEVRASVGKAQQSKLFGEISGQIYLAMVPDGAAPPAVGPPPAPPPVTAPPLATPPAPTYPPVRPLPPTPVLGDWLGNCQDIHFAYAFQVPGPFDRLSAVTMPRPGESQGTTYPVGSKINGWTILRVTDREVELEAGGQRCVRPMEAAN